MLKPGQYGWANSPLTEGEIAEWKWQLGSTDAERIAVLRDLLRNQGRDHMTEYDRSICGRTLLELQRKEAAKAATP